MMAIRRGALRRPCKNCSSYFAPTTKYCWVCDKCLAKIKKDKKNNLWKISDDK